MTHLPLGRGTGRLFRGIALAALLPLLFFAACANPNSGSSVTGVIVSPSTASVAKGGNQTFIATVNGENSPPQTVTWSIVEDGTASGTTISSGGILTVAGDETLTTLTVKAASTVDTTKYGQANVTVSGGGGTPSVTSVSVSPTAASVVRGQTKQFSATVHGTGGPDPTVTWTVEGGGDGTTINSSGILSVAEGESAGTLTVKATSTVDTTKYGQANVSLYDSEEEIPTPTVTSVSVSPSTASVAKGGNQTFSATVSGENNPDETVTWSIVESGKASGTTITSDGVLTVAADETLATLTVRATSDFDDTKYGTANVTVPAPAVTGVSVSPSTASVAKGGNHTFTAEVTGTNNPDHTVTWSIVESGKASGTTISAGGVLTVAADETLAALTVKATSTFDTTKSGQANVTVTPPDDSGPGITFTGIDPRYNGQYAAFRSSSASSFQLTGGGDFLVGGSNPNEQGITGVQISNGSVTIPVYLLNSEPEELIGPYGGSDQNITIRVFTKNESSFTYQEVFDGERAFTVDSVNFTNGTATVTVTETEAISIEDSTAITNYLNKASGGTTASNPASLAIKGNLSDGNWTALLSAIQTANKYVALDLSAASMSGAEFDPGTANTGASKIVSLALPNAATSIKGTFNSMNFTALTSVSGSAVETIGNKAFIYCSSLTTVSLPAATDIGGRAFDSCTSLITVSLPKVASIGSQAFWDCTSLAELSLPATLTSISVDAFVGCTNLTAINVDAANPNYRGENGMLLNKAGTTLLAYPSARGVVILATVTAIDIAAFYSCKSLTEVSLPAATSIGEHAFDNCTSLTEVSLPAATSIGEQAFHHTGETALTVTLGSTVPTLGIRLFHEVYPAKTVTVKVPSGAAAWSGKTGTFSGTNATVNWGNSFRGGGWDGSAFVSGGEVNSYITLTVKYQ